jgi:hypothetical protein
LAIYLLAPIPTLPQKDQKGFPGYLPTPGSQRKPGPSLPRGGEDDVIDHLMALLDEDCLMALRASIDRPYTLPFKVGMDTFIEWQQDSSDLGGYEYDAQRKEIIIKSLPGPLHERVVGVFNDWFVQLKQEFKHKGTRLQLTANEGLSLFL